MPATGPAREHLLVLPSADQLDAASRAGRETGVTLTAAVDAPATARDNVEVVPAAELAARTAAPPGARAMCCHERGVYWVAERRRAVGALNFGERCLRMLTKDAAARELAAAGVPVLPKRRVAAGGDAGAPGFPLVAKPNFGFASMLVKRVGDAESLRRYQRDFHALRERSLLTEYEAFARDHIGPEAYDIVLEPDLSAHATFLTVPFLVHGGELRRFFPVLGAGTRADDLTDFGWSGFRTGEPPAGAGPALAEVLGRITSGLGLTGGVYEAELLHDDRTAEVFVLEFSPRVTGGLIPELVRLATGVDLHLYGTLYFLGADHPLPAARPVRPLLLTLRRETDPVPPGARGPLLASRRRVLGGVPHVDEIRQAAPAAGGGPQ